MVNGIITLSFGIFMDLFAVLSMIYFLVAYTLSLISILRSYLVVN